MTATLVSTVAGRPGHARARGRVLSPWRILAVATAVVLALRSVHPIFDIDLYWHIPLGNQIIATHSVSHAGASFAYTFPHSHWVTTQWLSEVILATLYNLGGFGAISLMRVVLSVALMAFIGWQLLRGTRTIWSPIVFAITCYISSSYFQERPQLFSLFFVVWLAGIMRDELAGHRTKHWWWVLAITWLWANVHGLWVMVPSCYLVLAVGRLADRRSWRALARPVGIALASLVAASLTPVGPKLLLSPIGFAEATKQIQEWQPTNFHNGVSIALGVLVAAAVLAWVRGSRAVSHSEIIYVGAITAFALFSMRDVPPAGILLAPVVLRRLETTIPRPDRSGSRREHRLVTAATGLLLSFGFVATVAQVVRTPTLPASVPVNLAAQIAHSPGPHRVLDDYNASGAVIFWGGPHTQVAIDGRADRYGARYIADYSKLMLTTGDWEEQLANLNPNYALLDAQVPLVRELTQRGWMILGFEGKWVLLRAGSGT